MGDMDKKWERLNQLLAAEASGRSQPMISSQRTLFGIKSHVEDVIGKVAEEETDRCMSLIHDKHDRDNRP